MPKLEQTRSISRYGLSQVTVIFKEGTDIYFARQLVGERIQEARGKLPSGLTPSLGPIATGLGEIYMWTVETEPGARKPSTVAPLPPLDLREIQDWVIKPQLRTVPGVTEINTIGGYAKEFQVAPLPDRLVAYGLGIPDLVTALERNNDNVGAGYIERRGEQYLIRAPGQLGGLDDIANVVVPTSRASPCASATWPRSASARSCAPVPRPRTARRSCSARSSCCWARTAAMFRPRSTSA